MKAPAKRTNVTTTMVIVAAIYWTVFAVAALGCFVDWNSMDHVTHVTVWSIGAVILVMMSCITWLVWRDSKAIAQSASALHARVRVPARMY